jgi:hypothetical protein
VVTAAQCKASGTVLYNGSCQRRGNSCCGGKGYLAQVSANNGWGQCLTYRTYKPCTAASAPKQTNYGCASNCNQHNVLSLGLPKCGGCSKETLIARSQTNKCPAMCDNGNVMANLGTCGSCTKEQLLARGPGVGSSGKGSTAPGGSANPNTGGGKSPSGCNNCSPIDIGCQIGKNFCEFQHWLAGSIGNLGMPVMIGGGLIIGILLLKR